jgi:hypothetical protein
MFDEGNISPPTLPRYRTTASSPVTVSAVNPKATLTVVAISALLGGSR